MALIKCPKCGGLLSDKATKCPHCGFSIEEVKASEPKQTAEVEVSNEEQKESASHKETTEGNSKTALIIIIIAILAFVMACFIGSLTNQSAAPAVIEADTCEVAEATEVVEKYSYEFVVNGTTLRLTFNKSEETAKLEVDGHTFYGTCDFDGLYHKGQIEVTDFEGADDYDIHRGDTQASWYSGIWIDYANNYLYTSSAAARSLNPDYRIELKPIR